MSTTELRALRQRVAALEAALSTAGSTRLSFSSARATLDEIARLPQNWDSYGALPPTAVAISTAHGLLAGVAERYADSANAHALPWATAPLADGGVQFEWRGLGGAIEVEIGPAGRTGYLVEHDEQTVARSLPNDSASLAEIMTHLERVLRP